MRNGTPFKDWVLPPGLERIRRKLAGSADAVLNILSRQREPAPPVTIMTPDALRLTHAPIADCTRYDSLRNVT